MTFRFVVQSIVRHLDRVFFAVALLCLGTWTWAKLDSSFYEAMQGRRLSGILAHPKQHRLHRGTNWKATATRGEVRESGMVGRIEIARLNIHGIVAEGTTPRALRRAVGHLPKTPYPGERGNVVLAAHRDSFFRNLKQVKIGDRIRISTPDGVFEYRVESKRIVRPQQTEVLADTRAPTLTLVTCYPFHYVGNAPNRFIVRARQTYPSTQEISRTASPSANPPPAP